MARIIQEHTQKLPENHELDVQLVQCGTKKEVRIRIYRVNYGPFGIKLARHRVEGWTRRLLSSDDCTFEELTRHNIQKALNHVARRIKTADELAEMEVIVR